MESVPQQTQTPKVPKYFIESDISFSREGNEVEIHQKGIQLTRIRIESIASVMAFLSKSGETSESYQKALDFLNS